MSTTPDRLRIVVIDDHEISRGAYCALLRTEGLEPIEVGADDVLVAARALDPDVVLIDAGSWRDAAQHVCSLPGGPAVIVISSAQPVSSLDGLPFLPKADICARAIRELISDELSAPTESQ